MCVLTIKFTSTMNYLYSYINIIKRHLLSKKRSITQSRILPSYYAQLTHLSSTRDCKYRQFGGNASRDPTLSTFLTHRIRLSGHCSCPSALLGFWVCQRASQARWSTASTARARQNGARPLSRHGAAACTADLPPENSACSGGILTLTAAATDSVHTRRTRRAHLPARRRRSGLVASSLAALKAALSPYTHTIKFSSCIRPGDSAAGPRLQPAADGGDC